MENPKVEDISTASLTLDSDIVGAVEALFQRGSVKALKIEHRLLSASPNLSIDRAQPMNKGHLQLPVIWLGNASQPASQKSLRCQEEIALRPLYADEPVIFGTQGNADVYLIGDDCHPPERQVRWTKYGICRFAFNARFSVS